MATQNVWKNAGKHYRGGISVRLSKGEFNWFGFKMKSGFIFSNSGEYCYVFTGVTGTARDRAGNYKTLRVFVRNSPDPRASFRDFTGDDWHVEYLSSRDPLGAKMLAKAAKWAAEGWTIRADRSGQPSTGRHWAQRANCEVSRVRSPWESDDVPTGYTWDCANKASPFRTKEA